MAEASPFVGVDLFCGAGGMSLGFQQAGVSIAGGVDCNRTDLQTYELNFPDAAAVCMDLSSVRADEVLGELSSAGWGTPDIVFGGPPCQGFSTIGRRDPADERNDLILDFLRIVGGMGARYFVMENVAGLLADRAKPCMEAFLARASDLGYSVRCPVEILCASDFGVPQRRRRAFILGALVGVPLPEYPAPLNGPGCAGGPSGTTVWDAIGDLPNVDDVPYLVEGDCYEGALREPSEYAAVMRGERSDPDDLAPQRERNGGGLTGCRRTLHTAATVARFAATAPGSTDKVSRFPRLTKGGVAPALRAGTGRDRGSHTAARPIHPVHPRCVTVRESARLHSLPDWFGVQSVKWHGLRQVGNSVPPRLARAVAKAVVRAAADER